MSAELAALYRDLVLAHSREPHHFGRLDNPDVVAKGDNPMCGDTLSLYLKIEGDEINDVSFQGHGCAISMASASMLTDMVHSASLDEARDTLARVTDMLSAEDGTSVDAAIANEPVAALAAVRQYPSRIKCATLAWQALESALSGSTQTVTTEKTDP